MKLINLTKHALNLHDTSGNAVEIPADARHLGVVALGDHRTVQNESGHAFSVNERHVTEIKGMPEPEDDTLLIVPVEVAMVLQQHRNDVVFAAEDEDVPGPDGRPQRITHLRRVVARIGASDS